MKIILTYTLSAFRVMALPFVALLEAVRHLRRVAKHEAELRRVLCSRGYDYERSDPSPTEDDAWVDEIEKELQK